MSIALNLYRLQQIDTRLDQVTSRQAAIQSALENDAALKAARLHQESAEAALKASEQALKQAENEAANQRIKLEQAESSLYSGRIQNPKELADLQNDVAALKRHLATLEDRQLEAILALEDARAALDSAKKEYLLTQGQVISQNASLKTEQDFLQKEAETLTAQRLAVLPMIDSQSLARYDTLRQQRRGLAVTTISEDACNACGAALTRGHAQSVRFSQQIVHCPSCGRILFAG
ncbi:MAG: zinc ribbon domain-containing protein [Anaerolineales bacterium]